MNEKSTTGVWITRAKGETGNEILLVRDGRKEKIKESVERDV
uniref:Uncharacterized protein n=1 Tax=Tarenaya spinosa TaxID=228870 RepID=Q1KUT9_9ROSI|nr:hypothetical protein [Tarenaya spinosa]